MSDPVIEELARTPRRGAYNPWPASDESDDGARPEECRHETYVFNTRLDEYFCSDCGAILLEMSDYDY